MDELFQIIPAKAGEKSLIEGEYKRYTSQEYSSTRSVMSSLKSLLVENREISMKIFPKKTDPFSFHFE